MSLSKMLRRRAMSESALSVSSSIDSDSSELDGLSPSLHSPHSSSSNYNSNTNFNSSNTIFPSSSENIFETKTLLSLNEGGGGGGGSCSIHSSPRGDAASRRELRNCNSGSSSNSNSNSNSSNISHQRRQGDDDQVKIGYVTNLKLPNGGVYTGQIILQPLDAATTAAAAANSSIRKSRSNSMTNSSNIQSTNRNNNYNAVLKKGTLREKNGDVYSGTWVDGHYSGMGKKVFKNGDVHVGNYRDGKRSGFGTFTSRHGDSYTGDWKDGSFHGIGKFVWSSTGEVYSGNWVDGTMTGLGKKVQTDGYIEGWFVDDCSHGISRKSFNNGDVYSGNYFYNDKQGFGEYSWSDGSRYIGSWTGDYMSGPGEHFISKKFAKKCIVSDEKASTTVFVVDAEDANTPISSSSTHSHTSHSSTPVSPISAAVKWTNLVYYKGTFLESCRHGFGVAVALNGDILFGNFDSNLPHGVCTCYSFVNSEKKQCYGRMLVYEGEYCSAAKVGKGKLRLGTLSDFIHVLDNIPHNILSSINNLKKILPFLIDFKEVEDFSRREDFRNYAPPVRYSSTSSYSTIAATTARSSSCYRYSVNMQNDFDDLERQLETTPIEYDSPKLADLKGKYGSLLSELVEVDNDAHTPIITADEWKARLIGGASLLETIVFMQPNPFINCLKQPRNNTLSNVHGQRFVDDTEVVSLEFIGTFLEDSAHGSAQLCVVNLSHLHHMSHMEREEEVDMLGMASQASDGGRSSHPTRVSVGATFEMGAIAT